MRGRPYFLYLQAAVLATLVLWAYPAFAGNTPMPGAAPGPDGPTETVPFQLYQGYLIVVHGSIGSAKNLNFFLDTGATPAILDSGLADKLNLQGKASVSIVRLDRRRPAEEANLPSLEIGPLKRSNLRVVTADLSFYEKILPVKIDAIVGLDVLGQGPFMIDYPGRVIRFGPAPPLSFSVPLRLDQGLAVFDAEIDHTPVHLLFDTGAGFITLFDRAIPQSAGAKGDPRAQSRTTAAPEERQVWVRNLRLGSKEFGQKAALLTRNPKPSQIDFDGLMSPAALGISRVVVDLKAGVLAFNR
ncbi:MAG: retropepsin-like aspartic protease [Acidobacteriaceae bacterium]